MDYESLLDILQRRRNIRRMKSDPVPDELIEKVIEAARWAPSGDNTQPWEFIVVKDPDTISRIADVYLEQTERRVVDKMGFPRINRTWLKRVPAMVVICCDPRYRRAYPYLEGDDEKARGIQKNGERILYMGMGAAIQNFHLAVTALGLATAWMTGVGETIDMRKAQEILGVPEQIELVMVAPLGYPPAVPKPGPRKELPRLIHRELYDMSRFVDDEAMLKRIKDRRARLSPGAEPDVHLNAD